MNRKEQGVATSEGLEGEKRRNIYFNYIIISKNKLKKNMRQRDGCKIGHLQHPQEPTGEIMLKFPIELSLHG